ncbi:MAG: FAD-dependent oxidoreductase [Firmicutes bacterium]|nr:FAD-dependent oxidoreductase [Bacillota bacterium]
MTSRPRVIVEPAREVPVLLDVDVVVAGAGSAGPMAAIAAARQGVKVVLIERFGALGGNLTVGMNSKPSGLLPGGIPLEFWERAQAIGAAGTRYVADIGEGNIGLTAPCDPEMAKVLLARMCTEAGVQILFEAMVVAPIVEENQVKGVIIECKDGRRAILAKVVIDCTADGDVAASAGAPFIVGSEEGAMQPVSMYFKMNEVDIEKFAEWARNHPEDVTERYISPDKPEYGIWATGFERMLKKFQAETGIKLQRENITLKTAYGKTEVFCNSTRVIGASGLSVLDISNAIMELYRQIEANARFLRENVPGFENAYINGISSMLGVRETRHILGEYVLTGQDVMSGKHFDDSIAVDLAAMDIHDVRGSLVRFESYPPYEIPYRCLVPQEIDQVLVAGRCISNDHVAHGRTRNIPACMSTGQAAGFAAAVAVKTGRLVREVDVKSVQELVLATGMPIDARQVEI